MMMAKMISFDQVTLRPPKSLWRRFWCFSDSVVLIGLLVVLVDLVDLSLVVIIVL